MSKTVINSKVVDTDSFLEMPPTSRLLYYDLLLRSDNDGFITPLKVIRLTGASQDDLKILVAKGFAYAWDDGVIVLLHYREHNHVKHYSPSDYWPRLRQLRGKYAMGAREDGATLAPGRGQDSANVAPQVKLSKDKINKDNTYNTTDVVLASPSASCQKWLDEFESALGFKITKEPKKNEAAIKAIISDTSTEQLHAALAYLNWIKKERRAKERPHWFQYVTSFIKIRSFWDSIQAGLCDGTDHDFSRKMELNDFYNH